MPVVNDCGRVRNAPQVAHFRSKLMMVVKKRLEIEVELQAEPGAKGRIALDSNRAIGHKLGTLGKPYFLRLIPSGELVREIPLGGSP